MLTLLHSGLGIGTSPDALTKHGITTTAVEIDPAVSVFASKYFSLPSNVTVINEDALTFVERTMSTSPAYSYIIHDVFTGGAEPLELFTYEFLLGLRDMMAPAGSVAIVGYFDVIT